tara:strand:- start:96 stop:200 length:105 start_codon:yes stop_codon:yes gene_type:complete
MLNRFEREIDKYRIICHAPDEGFISNEDFEKYKT